MTDDLSPDDDLDLDELFYKVEILIPKAAKDWYEKFFNEIADAAYDVQALFDADHPNVRDWDIFVSGIGPGISDA